MQSKLFESYGDRTVGFESEHVIAETYDSHDPSLALSIKCMRLQKRHRILLSTAVLVLGRTMAVWNDGGGDEAHKPSALVLGCLTRDVPRYLKSSASY